MNILINGRIYTPGSAYHQEKKDRHPPSCQVARSCFLPWLRFSFGKNDLLATIARRLINFANSWYGNYTRLAYDLVYELNSSCLLSNQLSKQVFLDNWCLSSIISCQYRYDSWFIAAITDYYAPLFLAIAQYWVLIEVAITDLRPVMDCSVMSLSCS